MGRVNPERKPQSNQYFPLPEVTATEPLCSCHKRIAWKLDAHGRYYQITKTVYNPECMKHGQIGS